MRYIILAAVAVLAMSGCQDAGTASSNSSSTEKRYDIRGTVVSVDKSTRRAKIDHEEIPGFMDRMTMDFPIKEDWVWDELRPGAEIRAVLVVDSTAKDPYWLEKIGIVAAPKEGEPQLPTQNADHGVDNDVPDFRLTNQDGKRFSLRDYKGKALAITFIYRECPLPEFCIKMSRNFSDLAIRLNSDTELKKKIRLLSISFDPARDTPQKLRSYGQGYLGNDPNPDFTVWQLAVAPESETRKIAEFFGLRYKVDDNDKTQFNHTLVTVVISPEGKIMVKSEGSDWTPTDLLEQLQATLK